LGEQYQMATENVKTPPAVNIQSLDTEGGKWEQAMVLAEDLSETNAVGHRQAQVVVAVDLFGFGRDEIMERLGIGQDNFYNSMYQGRDRIKESQQLARKLRRHPLLKEGDYPVTFIDWTENIRPEETEYHHRKGESRVGEQFALDERVLVTVQSELPGASQDEIAGYALSLVELETGTQERRAIAASQLDKLVDIGRFTPGTAVIECSVKKAMRENQNTESGP
jgi:hypothetical protein